jgi:hypothetical protein
VKGTDPVPTIRSSRTREATVPVPRERSAARHSALSSCTAPHNNEMNRPNRGVPGMKERRPSGEPVLAEVGPPVILSLDVAGYFSVMRT